MQPDTLTPALPANVCTDISRLPLEAFISALLDGDLSGLVLSGTASEEALLEAWEALQLQYVEACAGKKETISLLTDVGRKSEASRLLRINGLLKMAIETGHPALAHALKEDGYEYDPTGTAQEREAQVNIIRNMLAGEEMRLQNAMGKVEGEDEDEKVPLSRSWFDNVLITAGESLGHFIPSAGLFTGQFCIYYRRLMSAIDKQKAATAGK